jgi:hypothetical protein
MRTFEIDSLNNFEMYIIIYYLQYTVQYIAEQKNKFENLCLLTILSPFPIANYGINLRVY